MESEVDTADSKILAALDDLLRSDPGEESVLDPGTSRVAVFANLIKGATSPKTTALFRALQEDDEVRCAFDGKQYNAWSVAYSPKIEEVFIWLVDRSQNPEVGSLQAVQELRTFIRSDEIDRWAVMILVGPPIHGGRDIGGGVRLANLSELPTQRLRESFQPSDPWSVDANSPSYALVMPLRSRKIVREVGDPRPMERHAEDLSRLEDARLCIAVSIPHGVGIQGLVVAVAMDDSVPIGRGFSPMRHRYHPLALEMRCRELNSQPAKEIFEVFSNLDEDHKRKLRIPMRKLCDAVSAGHDLLEKSLSLRTAIEALFTTDSESKWITDKVKKRSALLLASESDAERRDHIRNVMKLSYDAGSKVVHNGRFVGDQEQLYKRPVNEAVELARQAILFFIQHPHWLGSQDFWERAKETSGANVPRP